MFGSQYNSLAILIALQATGSESEDCLRNPRLPPPPPWLPEDEGRKPSFRNLSAPIIHSPPELKWHKEFHTETLKSYRHNRPPRQASSNLSFISSKLMENPCHLSHRRQIAPRATSSNRGATLALRGLKTIHNLFRLHQLPRSPRLGPRPPAPLLP